MLICSVLSSSSPISNLRKIVVASHSSYLIDFHKIYHKFQKKLAGDNLKLWNLID